MGTTLREIFKAIEENKLVLPDFQREFVWEIEKQKRLLASLLVKLPIGSFLILEGERGMFPAKKVCYVSEYINLNEVKEECGYILDGQQRISTLCSAFKDYGNDIEKIYKNLRYRWFLRIKPQDGEEDIFGWTRLKFNGLDKYEPEQVIDFIECKKINEREKNKWFHPKYKMELLENDEMNKRLNEIAEKAAEEYFVPLYSIWQYTAHDKDQDLHRQVLYKIAEKRRDELKADMKDGKIKPEDILSNINPLIRQYIESGLEEKINDAWASLVARWVESVASYLENLFDTEINLIKLDKDQMPRAISVFESINEGGTQLSVYDLVVAKAATPDLISLTNRIKEIVITKIDISDALWGNNIGSKPTNWQANRIGLIEDNNISKFFKNQYLNLLSLYSNVKYGNVDELKVELIKKSKQLSIERDKINTNTEKVVRALIKAAAFLHFRCGVIGVTNIPYDLMILPIAYVFIHDDEFQYNSFKVWDDRKSLNKIEYWYWASLFGGAYRERQNEQCIRDIVTLYKWIFEKDNEEINKYFKRYYDRILEEEGYSNLQVLLREDPIHDTIPKAIEKAILQYIISLQPLDFKPDKDIYITAWDIAENKIQVNIHHICPLASGKDIKIGQSTKAIREKKDHILNSPLNMTYISKEANNAIKEMDLRIYLEKINQLARHEHLMPDINMHSEYRGEEAFFKEFLKKRYEKLKDCIKRELNRLLT
ncbi:protein of unknown function DUF262 [Caldicellulosiruptor kronotskyensis 2002]|uniref:GmrSD restriction endonucleases N-terminal domain-containing protein n=1 Tax=Caldicellulosiruptor kronotskyensis (strain DSM 18902 / VKM B-2412 / 2002) TaxID=632348 RepID=E4SC24_CALK2|nr:DUF262 domain-containing protein [Caldicellulosiruptor kronotskyensis]ADQ44949.1 protein of unknown function DUF262 [Caldicellulosiruptor kronotskyensis 2002]